MKKPVTEYTDDEIQKRLDFADKIMASQEEANMCPLLPKHLEVERRELIAEQLRRQQGVSGEGI